MSGVADLLTAKKSPTQIGTLKLDCAIRENHELSSTVTQNPVEDGVDIADHVIKQPRGLTVEGIITNTPAQILGQRLDQLVRSTGPKNYAQLAFAELERIYEASEAITIRGTFKTYTDMVMVSAPIARTQATGSMSLRFTATFTQIRKVALKSVTFNPNKTKKENAQPQKNKGKQTPSTSTGPEKRISFLKGTGLLD